MFADGVVPRLSQRLALGGLPAPILTELWGTLGVWVTRPWPVLHVVMTLAALYVAMKLMGDSPALEDGTAYAAWLTWGYGVAALLAFPAEPMAQGRSLLFLVVAAVILVVLPPAAFGLIHSRGERQRLQKIRPVVEQGERLLAAGDREAANRLFQTALALCDRVGPRGLSADHRLRLLDAQTQYALGRAYQAIGEQDQAVEAFFCAVAKAEMSGDFHTAVNALLTMAKEKGSSADSTAQYRAKSYFDQAAHLAQVSRDPALEFHCQRTIGRFIYAHYDPETYGEWSLTDADWAMEQALRLAREIGDPAAEADHQVHQDACATP
jgi:tetratricopeptide (TPR) repeat protein